jgi:undecaprenyl-diphosphatase
MTVLQAIVLGIVQGATEFIPISSSGHLVLVPHFLGWDLPEKEAFLFDVLVQVATLGAVLVYFWADLTGIARAMWQDLRRRSFGTAPQSRLGWFLILATLPAGAAGLFFKSTFEEAFSDPRAVGWFLLVTALLLLIGEWIGRRARSLESLAWLDALVVGLFQTLALYPGISRSGSTITGGLVRGLERPAAARFSFLMAVPIMLAAGGGALLDLFQLANPGGALPAMLAGFAAAAVVGYLSIRWLLAFLARRPVYVFAAYCTVLGLITLLTT